MRLLKQIITRRQRGFTIVELLVYMGLVAILLVFLTQIFTSLLDVRLEAEATSSIEQDSRYILSRMMYDIHRADSITTPAALGDTSTSLVLSIGAVTYTYALQGTNLMLTTTGSLQVNSFDTEVSGLSFRKLGNNPGTQAVQVTYTVTSKTSNPSGPETKTVTTSVGLR